MKTITIAGVVGFLFLGCDHPADDPSGFECTGACDTWGDGSDPSTIADDLIYDFDQLPTSGRAKIDLWLGSNWLSDDNGIAKCWAGEDTLSPVEKYEAAFGATGATDWERNNHGVDRDGYVMEHGFGWAAALAAGVAEPARAVEHNGITFEPWDLRALVAEAYLDMSFSQMGQSCYTLPEGTECEGINAGAFHVMITNVVGRMERAIVLDSGARILQEDYSSRSVVKEFQLQSANEIEEEVAAIVFDRPGQPYPFNDQEDLTFVLVHLTLVTAQDTVPWDLFAPPEDPGNPMDLSYILELNSQGRIIGGEWYHDGDRTDFAYELIWIPDLEQPYTDQNIEPSHRNPFVSIDDVRMLAHSSAN